MLYLVGLGLGDAKDITVKGLEIVKKADYVFLEAYTSILCVGKEVLVSAKGPVIIYVGMAGKKSWGGGGPGPIFSKTRGGPKEKFHYDWGWVIV